MLKEENVPNERLRRARHLKGWTQSDLAEALGTDFETVSRWERGITMPSGYFREHLCRVLEKTPEELGFVQNIDEPLTPLAAPCVFLAAAHLDAEHEFTTQLKAHLQARGVTVSSSRTLRRQGAQNQRQALQEAIHSAKTVLLIVSPETRSARLVHKALQIAEIYRTPICAVWIDGEDWQECLPSDCGELCATIDARERSDHQVFDEIATMLTETWPGSNEAEVSITPTKESAESTIEPRNPYKGLKAFRSEDRPDFFGRDALIHELLEALRESLTATEKHAGSARLLAIVGPSGSGKSSVVMAGLLPRLQEGGLPGSQHWLYLDPLLPGAHPLESLAVLLAKHLPEKSLKTLREDLEDDSTFGLHLQASLLGKPPENRVVLFIDQFEEVFTQTISEEQRQHFLDVLITAVTEPQGPTILILTLRADFYDRPMHYPELFQLIKANHSFVLPMNLKQLKEVIERPAELPDVHLSFEGDLVSDLLFEVQEQVGALPLLQFTLDQLFARRCGHQLTLKAYQDIGGVKGAVAKHAETTYAKLPSEELRQLARVLFLRLLDPGATVQDTTRRRITRSELVLSNVKESVMMEEVLRAFTTARLLTTDTMSGVATVEVSHEAVIREWTRLAEWLDGAREDVHHQQTISEDASEWERHGKSKDRLYRGTQLKEAQAWARRNTTSEKETLFLRAGAAKRLRDLLSGVLVVLLLLSTGVVAGVVMLLKAQFRDPTRVTTLVDGVPGSLRWAIENAPAGSTITFNPDLHGILLLTRGDLELTKNLSLRGPGAGMLVISSGSLGNIVHVTPAASITITDLAFKDSIISSSASSFITNEGKLSLTDDVISGNKVYRTDSNVFPTGSGGISNSGSLILTHSMVSNNLTTSNQGGGGIYNLDTGSLTLNNSTVSGNVASFGNGGGILNSGGLVLTNSTVSGNVAQNDGGGISILMNSNLALTNSTVSGNVAHRDGGGISALEGGTVILTNSTVSGNVAQHDGGGISHLSINYSSVSVLNTGSLTLTNSTLSENTAQHNGGGINNNSLEEAVLIFCTIYGNKAAKGGGINVEKSFISNGNQTVASSPITLTKSIVAGNSSAMGTDIAGPIITGGYNLIQNTSGTTIADPDHVHSTDLSGIPLNKIHIDSMLRNNGGNTQTHALLLASPAIDNIPLNACQIATDQRDMKRPNENENAYDTGSYEYVDEPA
jgi:parallel beta-helix repeat protein